MAEIENPRHSRPIDVHRWSEHPEVKALVEEIWKDYLPTQITGEAGEKRTGPKPKTSFKNQLRVLILDLYVAWLEDPTLSIGMSMSPNEWKANSRYNALHLSKKLIPITEALVIAGLVDISKGSYAGPGAKTNRTTRIRASEGLQDMFQGAQFRREDIHTFSEQEVIILRDEKVLGKVGKQLEYEDTTDTIRMRKELRDYNDLLAASFIDIATLQTPDIPKGERDNTSLPIRIQPETCRLRRVFSRGNWSMNGRFYGGWWQQVNDEWRSKIFIDDQPTIEVDFKGLHVAMLYAQLGKAMEHDPYKLREEIGPEGEPECEGYPVNLARKLTKRLVLTAINAKGKSSAYKAFREGFSAGELGKAIRDKKLENLLQAFLQINPELEAFLFSDQGINLMYLDSQITAHIHNHFTQRSIPVLSVHDSYIIEHMRVAELRDVMAEASERVVGRPLATSIKLPDMPEYEHVSDEQLQEHIENRKGIRCVGYMDRLFTYQDRTGHRISPVVSGDAEVYYEY